MLHMQLTGFGVLLLAPEAKVLFYGLMPVKWRCKTCAGSKRVGLRETSLAAFKIFLADTIHVQGMPMNLARPIVTVSVERRNDARHVERGNPRCERATAQYLLKCTGNVVPDFDI